jgi:hypothetical protein
MNAPLAHSRFGGSGAERTLRCPASVSVIAQVPEHLRRTSTYADRGTVLHAAMTLLIDEKETLESLVGKTIGNYMITDDDVETTLRPVFTYVTALLDTPGAEFFLELHLTFPAVAGAFGTADLIVRIDDTIYVIDYKMGAGIRVLALSPADDDPGVDVINSQLAFYGCAARHSLTEFFVSVERIVLVILQPQSVEPDAEMVGELPGPPVASRSIR